VEQYYENGNCGLHRALKKAIPGMDVSIMNLKYWLSTSRQKAKKITDKVLSKVQKFMHSKDIVWEYLHKRIRIER